MSKIITVFLSLLVISTLTTTTTYADDCKQLTTDPPQIFDNTPKAKFTINVGKNAAPGFSGWKIKIVCGFNSREVNATLEGSDSISTTINNDSFLGLTHPCEFSLDNPHQILVKAILDDGREIDQCTTNYIVKPSARQCVLDIDPKQGITSATVLNLTGQNLTPGGKFVIFVDDDAIDIPNNEYGRGLITTPWAGNVDTPAFGPKSIPQELMIPGFHNISLRQRKGTIPIGPGGIVDNPYNPLTSEKDFFGQMLCPLFFTVGTLDDPGGLITSGGTGKVDKGPFAVGAGQSCENIRDNPSIRSAIGCIHTNPVAFVKDLLKFVIGIGGGLAFLMMLLGAFQMVTSAGNPETLQAGKDRLTSAVIGLLFVIFAVLLLQIIGVGILDIPGFGK